MRWQVVEQHGDRERIIERDLSDLAALDLRFLLSALRTGGDRREYVIQQQTGFTSTAVAYLRGC